MLTVKPSTKTQAQQKQNLSATAYDVLIVGAGIAGLSCALYAAQKKLRIALIESQLPGGKLLREEQCLIPGFSGKGFALTSAVLEQLKEYKLVEQIQGQVIRVHALTPLYTCTLDDGHILHGRTLVLAMGAVPRSPLLQGLVEMTEAGYVKTGEDMGTSVPGIYAVGDIRDTGLRHTLLAAADGAVAGLRVAEYLR